VIVDGRLEKRIANVIKENEKTLIFNGIEEGAVLVMQPLINVLEGTLVEQLGDQQAGPGTGRGLGMQPAGAGESKKKNRAAKEKPGDITAESPDGASGQVIEKPTRKKPADSGDKTREKKKRTEKSQPE
jgi:hypothetical protein